MVLLPEVPPEGGSRKAFGVASSAWIVLGSLERREVLLTLIFSGRSANRIGKKTVRAATFSTALKS
eukprot:5130021-Amphidinium_carterae.1